jgi:cytochrome c oxidase cbb3-type subunit 3
MKREIKTENVNATRSSGIVRRHVVKIVSVILLMTATAQTFAQETATKSFLDDPFNHPMAPLYLVTSLLFVTLVLVVIVAIHMLRVLNIFVQQAEREKAAKLGIPYAPGISWWLKMWDELNTAVPLSQEKDIDLGHDFDGIRELDNHLPPWWKALFYGAIVWGIIYLIVYHFMGSMPLSGAEYENELAIAAEEARVYRASQPVAVIDENALVFTLDEPLIANGKKVFMSNNCGSCHRNDGGGNAIGPNLTDAYWIHGGAIKNVFLTIKTGFVEKGMPAWGKVMSPTDVRDVAFYVVSLQGTNPKDAKKAQGDLFVPAEVPAPADSTKGGK